MRQQEWHRQWKMFQDNERFLFADWIHPNTLEDFRGKDVLECGCGGGQHTSFVAPYAKSVVAVDLNTVDIARERTRQFRNVEFVDGDIGGMDLKREFDIVFSIGVVHHTDDPDRTVRNLARHVRSGGRLILWVYSDEGNSLVRNVVEPVRRLFFRRMERDTLLGISRVITSFMYFPIYTVYLLPLGFLPYHAYFGNFRRLSFERNVLNVFDKLNAPQVEFMSRDRVAGWLDEKSFRDVHISHYKGVSWRASGTLI